MPINRELSQFGSFVEVANSTKLGIVNPNVGIGTTNPTVKVEVHGDIKVVDGNIDANGNLDVDGYSDLDELNVTGIATFTNGIQCSGSAMNVTAGFVANTARVSDLTDNRVVIAGNSGELEGDSNFTFDGSTLSVGADFTLTGIDTGTSAGPEFKLFRNSSSPEDADYLGQIKFAGESDTGVERNYAKITGKILDASNGTEDGIIEFAHIKAGSQNISARFRSDSLQLLNGTNFAVAGDSTLTGDLDVDGHTDLDYVAVSAAATFTSLVDVNGGLQANTIKIEDLTDNRVVIAGVGGELEDNSKFTFNGETVNINAQLTVSGVSTFSGGLSMGSGSVGLTTNSITGPAEMFIDPAAVGDNTGVVRIKGDLYVDGTTTQINSETLTIADFVVGIASTATTDSLADGAGINIGPDNTFKYDHTNTSLKSSENLNVASGKTYKINGTDVLSATTLGSNVVNSSLTSVGTLGGLTVSGDVSIADKIVHTGDTNTAIRFPADDTVTVETAGSEALRVTSDGHMTMGVPTYSFNNAKGFDTYLGMAFNQYDGGILMTSSSGLYAGEWSFGLEASASHTHFVILDDANERLRITSDGKVGIGTDNPSDDLTIKNVHTLGLAGNAIKFYRDAGNYIILEGNSNAFLQFRHSSTDLVRITSAGLVGIGTNNPAKKVEIFDTAATVLQLNSTNSGGTSLRIQNSGTDKMYMGLAGDFITGQANNVTDSAIRASGALLFASGGGTERLRVTSDGDVGIGTDNPSGKLNIVGSDSQLLNLIQDSGDLAIRLNDRGAGSAYIKVPDSTGGSLAFETGGTERLRITSAGLVGIGTNNPSATFHVKSSTPRIRVEDNAGSIDITTNTNGDGIIQVNGTKPLRAFTAGSERLRVNSDGLVGINTDNPSFGQSTPISTYDPKLGVEGSILIGNLSTTATDRSELQFFRRSGAAGQPISNHDMGRIAWYGSTNDSNNSNLAWSIGVTPDGGNWISGVNRKGFMTFNNHDGERLRIASDGSVGIGTDNPSKKLHVDGTIFASGSTTSLDGGVRIKPNNDGINYGGVIYGGAHNDNNTAIHLRRGVDGDNNTIDINSYGMFRVFTNGALASQTEKLRITSAGLVGIGTDNPDEELTVVGTIKAVGSSDPSIRVSSTNTAYNGSMRLNTTNNTLEFFTRYAGTYYNNNLVLKQGNVGIGTDNPTNTLEISKVDNHGITLTRPAGGSNPGTVKFEVHSNGAGRLISERDFNLNFDTDNIGNQNFSVSANGSERLRITSAGNIGINSASPAVKLDIRSTDAIRVPVGTTGERPTGAAGYIRYNSSIASYEGHNGSEWAGIGGAAEVETAVSSTSATTCESFAKASYRSASIVAQITQGSSYQVGNYLLIHDGTTATLVEESAVATGDMLGTFTATISGSNVVFQVNMNSASSATVTSKMTKVSIP